MYTQTVALKDVKCYAFHGFYPEEQLTGSHFLVDVEVSFVPAQDTGEISNTVNYEVLNDIILEEMANAQQLLETVVRRIIDALLYRYPFLLTAVVGIRKLHPPMAGEIGASFVQLRYAAKG